MAHSMCPVGAGVDGKGVACTEGNVREAMHNARAVEGVCGIAQVVDTHRGSVP